MSPLSAVRDEDLHYCFGYDLIAEIKLFRKALTYLRTQNGDDICWMDLRHLMLRFLPGYDPVRDDVMIAENQLENCANFIRCWQHGKDWSCLGGDKGKDVPAQSIGTLDCLEQNND